MRADAIRYLVITPTNEVHIKVGVLTNDLLRKEVQAQKWSQYTTADENLAFVGADGLAKDNRLATAYLGEDFIAGNVVVTGPAGFEGVPASIPFDLCWAIMRYQEEVP